MRQSAVTAAPGCAAASRAGPVLAFSRPSCLFFCAHFPSRMLGTSRAVSLAAGPPRQNAAAQVLGSQAGRGPGSLRSTPASCPARPGQTTLGRPAREGEAGKGTGKGRRLRPRICPELGLLPGKLPAIVSATPAGVHRLRSPTGVGLGPDSAME